MELFDSLPVQGGMDALDDSHRRMFRSFIDGLKALGNGLTVDRIATSVCPYPLISVRISRSTVGPDLRFTQLVNSERRRDVAPFDPSEKRHQRLLSFLDAHPLVRKISLPGVLVRSVFQQRRVRPSKAAVPARDAAKSHPKIDVIDGGLGTALSAWVIDRWGLLADEDADLKHGSFIGGLAVLGRLLNGQQCCPEPDSVELVDVDVFPNERTKAFADYYPQDLPQFFDEVEVAIRDLRARSGVRIFNMSLNVSRPATLDQYDLYSARLDAIAEENNVIIFLSAGNIDRRDQRPE